MSPTVPLLAVNASDILKIYREMARHENELINQRMSWLLQFEGFLFAALAIVLEKDAGHSVLVLPLALLGIFAALSCWRVMQAALKGIKKLRENASALLISCSSEPGIRALDDKDDCDAPLWFLPWDWLPWVLVSGWVLIIVLIRWPHLLGCFWPAGT